MSGRASTNDNPQISQMPQILIRVHPRSSVSYFRRSLKFFWDTRYQEKKHARSIYL